MIERDRWEEYYYTMNYDYFYNGEFDRQWSEYLENKQQEAIEEIVNDFLSTL